MLTSEPITSCGQEVVTDWTDPDEGSSLDGKAPPQGPRQRAGVGYSKKEMPAPKAAHLGAKGESQSY